MVTDLETRGDRSAHWAAEPEIAAAEEVFDVCIHGLQAPRSDDRRTRIPGDEFPPPGMQRRAAIRLLYSQIARPGGPVGHYDALIDRSANVWSNMRPGRRLFEITGERTTTVRSEARSRSPCNTCGIAAMTGQRIPLSRAKPTWREASSLPRRRCRGRRPCGGVPVAEATAGGG